MFARRSLKRCSNLLYQKSCRKSWQRTFQPCELFGCRDQTQSKVGRFEFCMLVVIFWCTLTNQLIDDSFDFVMYGFLLNIYKNLVLELYENYSLCKVIYNIFQKKLCYEFYKEFFLNENIKRKVSSNAFFKRLCLNSE